MSTETTKQNMLEREAIANRPKHWVRAVTACNSRCVFCLDMDTPRNVFLPFEEVCADLQKGIDKGADKVILSGGEASLHPRYVDLIRFGKSIGYDRVQTVTNGWKYADRKFYKDCIEAGLGEITFSLHGHTAELHDRLTQHPGSFKRLLKGMIRAVRDRNGPIVNVDVVINKQNVAILDKIIELCSSLGVREFDLLHVIPQSEAYRNREMLFYDVRDHMDVLHKVFRLNRHPGFVIWTNRFPVEFLEGLEDLIQDPHKMLDEVNGRRFQVRRYLDTAEPLDCREPERCVHCFIEPFCTTMERVVEKQQTESYEVWEIGKDREIGCDSLPHGCSLIGVVVEHAVDVLGLFPDVNLEVRVETASSLPKDDREIRWIASGSAQLESWVDGLPAHQSLEIELNQDTEKWILEHLDIVEERREQLRFHQPFFEKLSQTSESDIRNPKQFFEKINVSIQTSGLPSCIAVGMSIQEPIARLPKNIFDLESGRLDIHELSKHHIVSGYRSKSIRCSDCKLNDRCDGIHINMVRDQGLRLAEPLIEGEWFEEAQKQLLTLYPEPLSRISSGMKPQGVATSLPGFASPKEPPRDPLAVLAEKKEAMQKEKKRLRKLKLGLPTEEN